MTNPSTLQLNSIHDGVNTNLEPRFSWPMLSTAFILFLGTVSYWLISTSSPASLVNALLNKMSGEPPLYLRFVVHLAVTIIGMMILYNSRIHEWTAWKISTSGLIVGRFYKSAAETIRHIWIVRGLLIAVSCLFLYRALLTATSDPFPPRMECAAVLFFSLLILLTWNIKHIRPDAVGTTSFMSSRNKTKWISLDRSQIMAAYIMDPHVNENLWKLSNSDWIDLSYREAYIVNRTSLIHEIKEAVLSENMAGSVKYYFRIAPDFKKLPETMNSIQMKALYTDFITQDNLKTFIFLAIGKDKVKNLDDLWVEISQILGKAWNNTHNANDNIGAQLQDQLSELTKKITHFASIASECATMVKEQVQQTFDDVDMFTIIFELKDASNFKSEYDRLKKFIEERASAKSKTGDDIEMKYTDATISIGTNAAMSTSRIHDLNEAREQHKTIAAGAVKQAAALPPAPVELQIASEKLTKVFKSAMQLAQNSEGILDPELMLKIISNSTNYFSAQRIEPDDFLQLMKVKLNEEKEERNDEAFRQLVEDTLSELSKTKK